MDPLDPNNETPGYPGKMEGTMGAGGVHQNVDCGGRRRRRRRRRFFDDDCDDGPSIGGARFSAVDGFLTATAERFHVDNRNAHAITNRDVLKEAAKGRDLQWMLAKEASKELCDAKEDIIEDLCDLSKQLQNTQKAIQDQLTECCDDLGGTLGTALAIIQQIAAVLGIPPDGAPVAGAAVTALNAGQARELQELMGDLRSTLQTPRTGK